MRFLNPFCPQCGKLASGTVENVPGWARLDWPDAGLTADDGPELPIRCDYEGETVLHWDGQRTEYTNGQTKLWCDDCCEEWSTIDLDRLSSQLGEDWCVVPKGPLRDIPDGRTRSVVLDGPLADNSPPEPEPAPAPDPYEIPF